MRRIDQTRDRPSRPETKRALATGIIAVLLLAGAAFAVYKYQQADEITEPQTAPPVEASTIPSPRTTKPTPASKKREPRALTPSATSKNTEPEVSEPTVTASTPAPRVSSPYRCDGRTRCSQMSSCAEATFFLRNCPGTQMDGDNDGVPCEQQWCNN